MWRGGLSPESGHPTCNVIGTKAGAIVPSHGETGHTCHPLRHSYENRRHPLDLPVSSFRRKPESRGVAGVARTAPKRFHQSTPFFIPWCAGTSRRERFVRKIDSLNPIRHLYAAIGLNNVPIVGCGRGECSAGACPPLGSACRRRQNPTASIRCTEITPPGFHTLVCRHQPA